MKYIQFRKLSRYPNFYYLAMGYYAGLDFRRVGLCKNRIFSFGYFTPQLSFEPIASTLQAVKIIWVGNMSRLKRVIDILYPTQKTVESLTKIELPAGVNIEIK